MDKMANVYVYSVNAIAADILTNCQKQAQNFNQVPHVTVIVHNCAFIDVKQSAMCRLLFHYHGHHLIGLKPSLTLSLIHI